MKKDWSGNKKSTFIQLAASNHSDNIRDSNDYYATHPKALEELLKLESFSNVWECACGEGHLSEVLKKHGIHSKSSDLIDRGYGEVEDFLIGTKVWSGDIITNPPYRYAEDFVKVACETGANKVALFVGIQFLEGQKRKEMYKQYPISRVYISSSRLCCAMNGDFEKYKNSNARSYCWIIWQKDYKGDTILKWFN